MQWVMKLAGVCCVMAASLIAGMLLETQLKKRAAILREMGESLVFLEKEMTCHRAPVPEAFRSTALRCKTELREVFTEAASKVVQCDGKSFQELWEQSVNQKVPAGLLKPEELALLCELAAALCNTDTLLQKTLLNKYVDRFREADSIVSAECREKGQLYRRLTMAAGVFLIILFL